MAETKALINPGFGGRSDFALGFEDTLILDMSHCATAVFTLKSTTGGGQVNLEQSFDGVNWAAVQLLNTLGEVKKFPITDAIGLIRATLLDSDSSSFVSDVSSSTPQDSDYNDGTAVLNVVGFCLPVRH